MRQRDRKRQRQRETDSQPASQPDRQTDRQKQRAVWREGQVRGGLNVWDGVKCRQQVKKISLQKSCKAPKRGPDANDQEGRRKRRRRKKTPTKRKYMPRAYLRKGTPRPHYRYYYCYCY